MLRRCLWLICLLLWPIAANAEPGLCGSSAGKTLTAAPITGLCSSGAASTVSGGAGPWSWYCRGLLPGDAAQVCAALKEGYRFVNWTGPVAGTTAIMTVADAATAAQETAHFQLWTYVISTHGYADMVDFKGGASHSVVLKGDGTVVAWGGQEGQSSTVPAGIHAKAIDAGVYHTLIVKEDGTVAGYGQWVHPVAQPGDNNPTVTVNIPGGVQATAVAGGYAHSLALLPSGEVRGWGDNYWGQITIPDEAKSGVVAIAAGHSHNLALKDDGTVIGWGRSDNGQVPPPTASSRVPPQVMGKKIVAIAAKAYHSVALTADGQVIAWGANELGQNNVPASAQSGVVAIAAGGHHTVALKKDGTVVAWGDNKFNQSIVPTWLTGVSRIAAGTYHSYALRGKAPEGLALVAWGQNQSQQCEVPARAYTPVTNGTVVCSPAYPPWGTDSTCTIGSATGYGLAAFVVNGQSQTVSTDTAVIKGVKDFTDVTVGFSQGAQVSTFEIPALYKSTTIPITSFTASGQGAVTGYAITMTPTKPTTGWSSTAPTTFNVGTPGPHTVYAWAKDSAGNVSTGVSRTTNIDNAAPTVTTFNVTSPVNHYYTSINEVTASDGATGSGVTGYLVKDTQMNPDANTMGWATRAPGSYSFTDPGTKTLYAWAKDAAGNISAAKTATVVVDPNPPAITAFTVKTPSLSKAVTISALTATDAVSPIGGYMLTETATPVPANTDPRWGATKPTSYTFATDGEHILYAWAKDGAGNVSPPASSLVSIDATPPTVTAFVVPTMQKGLTVPVTNFEASDKGSSVTGYAVTTTNVAPTALMWKPTPPTSISVTSPGVKTLYAWVKDAVGNISAPFTATVNIDTTAPAVTFTVSKAANSLTVPISLSATDAGGIAGYMVKESATAPLTDDPGWSATAPATFTLSAGGTKTIYAWAKDPMGNVSVAKSATVTIDNVPPTVTTFTVKSPAGVKVPITAFTGTDNMGIGGYLVTETPNVPVNAVWSNVKPLTYTATTSGDKTLYGWVRDTAGNVCAAAKTATTTVDVVAPTVNFSAPPLLKTMTIPVTFSATDNQAVTGYQITTSQTAPTVWRTTPPTIFTVASSGVKTLYAWAKDTVGNTSYATATVNVDLTPPAVTFKASSPSNTLVVPLTLTATDAGGVAGYMVKETNLAPKATDAGWSAVAPATYTMAAPGTKTIYAWAKDQIGNVSVAKSAIITIDTTPPVLTAFAAKTPCGKNVPITSFLGTDNIGIGGYLVTESDAVPAANNPAWSTVKPATYSASASGALTLHGWVKDKAGNVCATSKTAAVNVDAEPPVVTSFVVPQAAKLAIPITDFKATDTNLTGYMITLTDKAPLPTALGWRTTAPTSFTVATAGPKTLYAWAKDALGNVSAPATANVTVDITKPVISAFTLQTTATSLTVPITSLTATDTGGTVAGYFLKESSLAPVATAPGWSDAVPADYTFATPGAKTLYLWVKDAAGNISYAKSARTAITLP
jgi:alpha-tubulin suppressor-like RCC1 family protein